MAYVLKSGSEFVTADNTGDGWYNSDINQARIFSTREQAEFDQAEIGGGLEIIEVTISI